MGSNGFLAGIFASVLVVAGCHGKAQQARCAVQVNELREWMRDVAAEGYGGSGDIPPANGKLVALDEHGPADDTVAGPVLMLSGSQALLDGRLAVDISKPAEAIAQMRDKRREWNGLWKQTHPGKVLLEGTSIVVVLSQTDVWSDITTVLDAAANGGYAKATFFFDRRLRLSPPPETPVSRDLQKRASGEFVDPSQKARILAEKRETPTVFARCPEVTESVGAWGTEAMTPDEKFAGLATRVPDGIEKCLCKVDFNEVKATYWFMLGRYSGSPKVHYTLTISPRGEPGVTDISAPRTDTWSSVYMAVVSAAKQHQRISFVAK